MNMSQHASIRAQQRSVPPLVVDWPNLFGEEDFDGRGGIRRYFSKRSRRKMEQAFGSGPVRRTADYLDTYFVESVDDGTIVTVGHRPHSGQGR